MGQWRERSSIVRSMQSYQSSPERLDLMFIEYDVECHRTRRFFANEILLLATATITTPRIRINAAVESLFGRNVRASFPADQTKHERENNSPNGGHFSSIKERDN